MAQPTITELKPLFTKFGLPPHVSLVPVLREVLRLQAALKTIAEDFDHEEQTHDHQPFKYGGTCRACLAARTLTGKS